MAAGKAKINLIQGTEFQTGRATYKVTKLTNTVGFRIGQKLSRDDVNEQIEKGIDVIIIGEK